MMELWAHRRDLAGWSWRLDELPPGICGLTDYAARTMTIDPRLDWGAWRGTVLHEALHAVRGPVRHHETEAEEALVEEMTARRLIPMDRLRDTRHMRTLRERARALHVDRALLNVRLSSLTEAERAMMDLDY